MSKYLVKVEETYRADSEAEAAAIINEAKSDTRFTLSKYSSQKKERKQKGEIIDEWVHISLVKTFDDEKEPVGNVEISYQT